jgi:ribosomal protein S18 acetylase RimI-like enzyme
MTPTFPDEPIDGFPEPPRTVTDAEAREIHLREATSADLDALVEMYLAFDPADRAQGIPPAGEEPIREWLELLENKETLHVIALHDDAVVGHVMLVSDTQGAYELAIFVLQAYQGAHIGTELVRTALGLSQRHGVERVWLSVERWNQPAVALYEKIGFERTGGGGFELEMALRLSAGDSEPGECAPE